MSSATPSRRCGVLKALSLILLGLWVFVLIALPPAWALLPRAESQFFIGAILAALVVAQWWTASRENSDAHGPVRPAVPTFRRRIATMVIISGIDVICVVPFWSVRFREAAAVSRRSPVLADLRLVLSLAREQLHRSGRINLASLVESGSISPACLRPLAMSIKPEPSRLRALERAIKGKKPRKVARILPEFSIFHVIQVNNRSSRKMRSMAIPIIVSSPLHDLQHGNVRYLACSDGEIVEIIASRWVGNASALFGERRRP